MSTAGVVILPLLGKMCLWVPCNSSVKFLHLCLHADLCLSLPTLIGILISLTLLSGKTVTFFPYSSNKLLRFLVGLFVLLCLVHFSIICSVHTFLLCSQSLEGTDILAFTTAPVFKCAFLLLHETCDLDYRSMSKEDFVFASVGSPGVAVAWNEFFSCPRCFYVDSNNWWCRPTYSPRNQSTSLPFQT